MKYLRHFRKRHTQLLRKLMSLVLTATFLVPLALDPMPARSTSSAPMLHTSGNQVLDSEGNVVRLLGVNVPSLCWSPNGDGTDETISLDAALDIWDCNLIRLPVNPDFWLGSEGDDYKQVVDAAIAQVEARGKYVLLDNHMYYQNWSHASDFWADAANRYKNNPHVLFGLYNEPVVNGSNWTEWQNGLQSIINTIRSTGANNIVTVSGQNWGFDLTKVLEGYALDDLGGNGIIYEAHAYPEKFPNGIPDWEKYIAAVANVYPLLIGECGPFLSSATSPTGSQISDPEFTNDTVIYKGQPLNQYMLEYMDTLLSYIDEYKLHLTAWSFHWGAIPCLLRLDKINFTPTAYGAMIKQYIANHRYEVLPVNKPSIIAGTIGTGKIAPGSNGIITGVVTNKSIAANAYRLTDGDLQTKFDIGGVGTANYFGVEYDLGESIPLSELRVFHHGNGLSIKGVTVYASDTPFDYNTMYLSAPAAQVAQPCADATRTIVPLSVTARYLLVFMTGVYDTQYNYYRPCEIQVFGQAESDPDPDPDPDPVNLAAGLIGIGKMAPGSNYVITGAASDKNIAPHASKLTDGDLNVKFDVGYVPTTSYFGVVYDLGASYNLTEIKVYDYGQTLGIKGLSIYASAQPFDYDTLYQQQPIATAIQSNPSAGLTSVNVATQARYVAVFMTGVYDTQYNYYRPCEIQIFGQDESDPDPDSDPDPVNLATGLIGIGKMAPGSNYVIAGAASDKNIAPHASKLTDGDLNVKFDVGYVPTTSYFGVVYDLGASYNLTEIKVYDYGQNLGIKGLSIYASAQPFDYDTLYQQQPIATAIQSNPSAGLTSVNVATQARYVAVFMTGVYDTQYHYYRPIEIEIWGTPNT